MSGEQDVAWSSDDAGGLLVRLVDPERVGPLLESFSAAAGVATAIIDPGGVVIRAANWQSLCTDFHRSHPETLALCLRSDTEMAVAACRTREPAVIYRCPNGLTDAVAPIVVGGKHVANAFVGQFLMDEPDRDWWASQAQRYGFDRDSYLDAVSAVPVLSEQKVRAALTFLVASTTLLAEIGTEALRRQETEAELRASNQLLRQSQSVGRIAHYVLDVPTGTWTCSPVLEEIFGIDSTFPHTVEGWAQILHPVDRHEMLRYLREDVLRDRRPFDREYRVVRIRDGETRWVHGLGSLDVDPQGRTLRMFGVIQDVTERRKAEERRRRTLERLRRSVDAAVATLARTVEMRDPYTAGHQERVAELAVAIGKRLKLPSKAMTSLRIAGLIHDLGKIAVPAEILAKPGALTEMEWQLIRRHPRTGYEILREMRFPGPVASIVHQHHERLDGSGYPQGLSGEAVRREARIIAVADVVEAMSSHRPYRPALGVEAALAEIGEQRGTKYDPAAVDACTALFRQDDFAFSHPA